MNDEQKLFFQVLKDYIHGKQTTFQVEDIDTDIFYDLIKRQNLIGIFYVQCRDSLNKHSEFYDKLHMGFRSNVFNAVNRERDLQEVSDAFRKDGIPFLIMKGIEVAKYYPVPYLRTMGDMDLIIHSHDRKKSDSLMQKMGFAMKIGGQAVWIYMRDVVMYEIHDHMMYQKLTNNVDYMSFFDNVWEYTQEVDGRMVIKPEFHFLYLMTHAAKHISNLGYGIRAFLDMIFITRNCPDMDWQWIETKLAELKLLTFVKTCFSLCRYWFDVEMPYDNLQLNEDFVAEVTEKIFKDGLWGHDNDENLVNEIARAAKKAKVPYWITAINETRKKIFLSYSKMQSSSKYSFIKGRPWLLPVAWVYRWGYSFIYKRKQSSATLFRPFVQSEEVHKREEFLSSWGL